MRDTFRIPDLSRVVKGTDFDARRGLRWTPDIMFLPLKEPPKGSLSVGYSQDYFSTGATTYVTVGYHCIVPVQACLNIQLWSGTGSAETAYVRWRYGAASTTLWEITETAIVENTRSFPAFNLPSGDLWVQMKTSNANDPAYLHFMVFLSSRPYYPLA